MSNGRNDWGVSFSRISFMNSVLNAHKNVQHFNRSQDIIYDIHRANQNDVLKLICADKYTFSLTDVFRVYSEFEGVQIIYVGGGWCSYTREAKEYCLDGEIGLFNSKELNGALWRDDFWGYHQTDDEGNPVYPFKPS